MDESGHTGEDVLNRDQPVYTLASVLIDEQTAQELIAPDHSGVEAHYVRLRRSAAGRRRIASILDSPLLNSRAVKTCAVHKRFAVAAKVVDLIIEPACYTAGIDLYRDGLHLYLANDIHHRWDGAAPEEYESFLKAFIAACRERTEAAIDATFHRFDRLVGRVGDVDSGVIEAFHDGRPAFEESIVRSHESGRVAELDLSAPAVMSLLYPWADQFKRPFNVIHDESRTLRRWTSIIAAFASADVPARTVHLANGSTINLPVRMDQFNFVESQHSAQVQVADIVAGATAELLRARAEPASEASPWVIQLGEMELIEWSVDGCVWPDPGFTPTRRASPWSIDQLTQAVFGGRRP